MKLVLGGVILLIVAGVGYIRLAPGDVERWHVMPDQVTEQTLPGGAIRVIPSADGAFERLDAIIRTTPRTHVLAGTPDSGMITYVTRSAVFGFPDYTTLRRAGDQLEIYGRLRFGKSDLGVNVARVDGWLMRLRQGG